MSSIVKMCQVCKDNTCLTKQGFARDVVRSLLNYQLMCACLSKSAKYLLIRASLAVAELRPTASSI